jgi:3-phenylpropionate/cinnamic acid dioxygenase small subunit
MDTKALALIDSLQNQYIRALDRKDLSAWLGLFSKDGQYLVIPSDNEAAGLPMALMMDDSYERLVDRVTYITKVWSFDEYQMRHFVQRVHSEQTEGGDHRVESHFTVFYTNQLGQAAILAVGRYEDVVTISGGTASFRKKKVVIDNFLLPMNVVYPL